MPAMAVMQQRNPYIQEIREEHLEIGELIGRGGFGEVYLAYDHNRHHICAVKMMIGAPEFIASEKYNLLAEVDKMCRVRDDNVISFFGLYINAKRGICGLVMPHMSYGSLHQLLRQTTTDLPWALRIRIVYQTARGMNALHLLEPTLIHMDLKPGNILLTDSLEVRVADFGLSRLKKHTSHSHTATPLSGTLTHIPPEHLEDMNLVPKTKFDVYSYGITVWEVLTRQEPYTNAVNTMQISMCVMKGQRPDLSAIPQDVEPRYEISTTVEPLMCMCWAQNPTERPEFSNVVSRMKHLGEHYEREARRCVQELNNAAALSWSAPNTHVPRPPTPRHTPPQRISEVSEMFQQSQQQGSHPRTFNHPRKLRYTIQTSQPAMYTMTSDRGQHNNPAAQQPTMNTHVYYALQQNTQSVIPTTQPPRPTSTPSAPPDSEHKKNIIAITDPNTGRNVVEDMAHGKSTTPPQTGSSSARDTPETPQEDSSLPPPVDQHEDIPALFAAQVAATLNSNKSQQQPQQQQQRILRPLLQMQGTGVHRLAIYPPSGVHGPGMHPRQPLTTHQMSQGQMAGMMVPPQQQQQPPMHYQPRKPIHIVDLPEGAVYAKEFVPQAPQVSRPAPPRERADPQ